MSPLFEKSQTKNLTFKKSMVYDEHRFYTSTAPNDGLQDGAKRAGQYQP